MDFYLLLNSSILNCMTVRRHPEQSQLAATAAFLGSLPAAGDSVGKGDAVTVQGC